MLEATIYKKLDDFTLDVSIEVEYGITGILGPSGCGKSLTLQCLAGLHTPDKGEIVLKNTTLFNSHMNMKTRHRQIGYVFQNYALFPHLNVKQNIAFGLKGKGKTKKEIDQLVNNMLSKIRLQKYENHYPEQLSGGQQQRVALARTLITEPKLLLLDEPFSALDYQIKHILEQELLEIIKENFSGIVLLVTHNMEEAYKLCDRIVLLNSGTVVQSGNKDEIFKNPSNVAAAKIIGCKNILKIEQLALINSTNKIRCDLGSMTVVLQKPLNKNASHIGIHAEVIQFIEKTSLLTNAFDYEVIEAVRGINQTSIKLKVGTVILNASVSNLVIDPVLRRQCDVYLPPDKLFLLTS